MYFSKDEVIELKENVIIGKLIPAGTGMKVYQDTQIKTELDDEQQSNETNETNEATADESNNEEASEDLVVEYKLLEKRVNVLKFTKYGSFFIFVLTIYVK